MIDIDPLVRKNIRALVPYSSARDEYEKSSPDPTIMLDANESPYPSEINRYPDPYQRSVKSRLSQVKGISPENIFLGNGSDEAIDLLIRAFCEPGMDKILITPPTYGMYKVSADINNAEQISVNLTEDFELNIPGIREVMDQAKMMFLCSPVNPTGNLLQKEDILTLVQSFNGIVVVDEAYIDFCPKDSSMISELDYYPNLVILQTLSKAWGMAGIRLGIAFAQERIIQILNRIKPPYNVNILTQKKALEVLNNEKEKDQHVDQILMEKDSLVIKLSSFPFVKKIYPSDGNFILVRFENAASVFHYLKDQKVIVRDRSNLPGCEGCLRITIGLPEENLELVKTLKNWKNG